MPVVLDVDPGVDDALALLVALRSPQLDVRAVTCVAGNVPVAQVVRNTRTVLAVAGAAGIPIGCGPDGPSRDGLDRHGPDGLAGLSADPGTPDAGDAVDVLTRAVRTAPAGTTLLALGPLTNVAAALRADTRLGGRLDRIVVVGGSVTPSGRVDFGPADFNLHHDRHATEVVLAAGVELLVHPSAHLTAAVPDVAVERLRRHGGRLQRFAARLLVHQRTRSGTARIGDAGAIAVVADAGSVDSGESAATVLEALLSDRSAR